MSTTEIPKPHPPSMERSINKLAYHVKEGATEASKVSEEYAKQWMKHANKYQWMYGRYGHHCGRGGRLLLGLTAGAFGGYLFAKNYTVVRRENAEYVAGEHPFRHHGFWREKKGEGHPAEK